MKKNWTELKAAEPEKDRSLEEILNEITVCGLDGMGADLYEELGRALLDYTRKMAWRWENIGYLDREDIASELTLKLLEKLRAMEGRMAMARTIAKNKCIDLYRGGKASRNVSSLDGLLEDGGYSPMDSAPLPERQALFPVRTDEAFELIRGLLSEKELGAWLHKMRTKNETIEEWAGSCEYTVPKDLRNAYTRANRKLEAAESQLCEIMLH